MILKEKYKKEIIPALQEKFGYKNALLVPHLKKVVINVGFGHHAKEKEYIANVEKGLIKLSGQKIVFTKAKKSISAFKVREGSIIGAKVTLRGQRMYDFTDKLVNITFPRVRDFRGISGRAFDGRGNYNIGVKEQIIFPEIEYDKVDALRGLNISITTTAKTDEECKALLTAFRFPFKN